MSENDSKDLYDRIDYEEYGDEPMYRQNADDWSVPLSRGKENWICLIGVPRDNPFKPPTYPGWHWRPDWPLRDQVMAIRCGRRIEPRDSAGAFQKTEYGYVIGQHEYPNRQGFRQLQKLVFNRPLPISPVFLCDGIESLNDPVLDNDHLRAVKNQIEVLKVTADCEEDVDELEYLRKFLNENTFRGRSSLADDGHKQCYDRVRKNIPAAIDLIFEKDPVLGEHFRKHVHIASKCHYDGDLSFQFPPDISKSG